MNQVGTQENSLTTCLHVMTHICIVFVLFVSFKR